MTKFYVGQKVRCVRTDWARGHRVEEGDVVTVSDLFDDLFRPRGHAGLLWVNCFEPIPEEESAPMQNPLPDPRPFAVGDQVTVLEDNADQAPVKAGDVGTVTCLGLYGSYFVEMETGKQWVFRERSLVHVGAPMQNAGPRPCTCSVGSACVSSAGPCDGIHPGGPVGYPGWLAQSQSAIAYDAATAAAGYPDGNPKTSFGRSKPSTRFIPPIAILELGAVMEAGAAKYGQMNWRDASVSLSVYTDAIMRHLLALMDGQDNDPETGKPHLAHIMAGAAIVLDANSLGKLKDDRPTHGVVAAYIAGATQGVVP